MPPVFFFHFFDRAFLVISRPEIYILGSCALVVRPNDLPFGTEGLGPSPPAGRITLRPSGDPTRGRADTSGDTEYTVLYSIWILLKSIGCIFRQKDPYVYSFLLCRVLLHAGGVAFLRHQYLSSLFL